MKSFRNLIQILTIYIAGRCFRKLISSEEVDESVLTKVLRDSHIEVLYTLLYSHHPWEKPHSRILFTQKYREVELTIILERLPHFKNNRIEHTATFLLKRYSLNRDFTLCVLEYTEKIAHSNDPLVCQKEFQWVE